MLSHQASAGSEAASSPRSSASGRHLAILLAVSAVLLTSNAQKPSLPSLDDCFYARKGVEMLRQGSFFDVTWNGRLNFQNPPLQFWILARSFGLFGENDFAARLPSILMGLGILLGLFFIGEKTLGREASLVGICLLLLTPYFVNNARRSMLEVPLTFWLVVAVAVFVRNIERPRLHLLFSLPLAAAMLTKSLLGLVPVFLVAGTWALASDLRRTLETRWIAAGTALGIFAGLSWSFHQWIRHGAEFVEKHYQEEILSRHAVSPDWSGFLLDYPGIFLRDFQIVILPAMAGAFLLWRKRELAGSTRALFLLWLVAFPVVLNFLGSRTARYVFPMLPALALSGGYWIHHRMPGRSHHLYTWITPLVGILAAGLFWLHPSSLTRDRNAAVKQNAALLNEVVPPTEPLPFLGNDYWVLANPFLYYVERELARPATTADTATTAALQSSSRLLLCERHRLAELEMGGVPFDVVLEAESWLLLRLNKRPG
jgi:4-amino-4-deoxy-L-arabinose transferase-like glycosyltransferase